MKFARKTAAKEKAFAPMFKALLRLSSMVLLAIAVIMAVLDATRSIAASMLIMTPLGRSWASLSPESLRQFEGWVISTLPGFLWDPIMLMLLGLPGFAIFAGVALLLALAGHRRWRDQSRFAA